VILVTGAESNTGQRVIRRLGKQGYNFSVLVKDIKKATDIKSSRIKYVEGELKKQGSLKKALEGIEHAFLLTSNTDNLVKLEKNFIDAAKESGVKYLVKYSALGADPDSRSALLRRHGKSEQYLKDSGLRYAIIRPNIFMQNFVNYFGSDIRDERKIFLPLNKAKCSYVDVRDTARLIAKVITQNGHKKKIMDVSGPESLSCGDLAELFSNALGKKVTYEDIKPKEFKKRMSAAGVPDREAEEYTELYKLLSDGICEEVTDWVYKVTEKQPRTFDEFLDDNISFFLKKKSKSKK
jgi:uncharacterized protein YbjT (DUF2867 family)